MNLIFFIKSATVDISKYTIKDIPGSSGRLDVISRCVLSALTNGDDLEENIQIWVFLDKYGAYIFDSISFKNETFPKSEILLTDYFVDFIKRTSRKVKYIDNPLNSIKRSNLGIFDAIKKFDKNQFHVYVLNEEGANFNEIITKIKSRDNLLFIIGDQSGDLLDSKELKNMNLINLSLGDRSYLASSTIRLIKMNLDLIV